jgi:hypothetical protein
MGRMVMGQWNGHIFCPVVAHTCATSAPAPRTTHLVPPVFKQKKSFCLNQETEVFWCRQALSQKFIYFSFLRQCLSQESEASAAAESAAVTAWASATESAVAAWFQWFCLVDGQGATVVFFAVHGFNGGLRLIVISHFDKAESFAPARVTIRNHACAVNLTKLRKQRFQFRIRHRVAQIPDVQFLAHFFLQTENSGFFLLLSEADRWKEAHIRPVR